jgi:hypothetical protein
MKLGLLDPSKHIDFAKFDSNSGDIEIIAKNRPKMMQMKDHFVHYGTTNGGVFTNVELDATGVRIIITGKVTGTYSSTNTTINADPKTGYVCIEWDNDGSNTSNSNTSNASGSGSSAKETPTHHAVVRCDDEELRQAIVSALKSLQ